MTGNSASHFLIIHDISPASISWAETVMNTRSNYLFIFITSHLVKIMWFFFSSGLNLTSAITRSGSVTSKDFYHSVTVSAAHSSASGSRACTAGESYENVRKLWLQMFYSMSSGAVPSNLMIQIWQNVLQSYYRFLFKLHLSHCPQHDTQGSVACLKHDCSRRSHENDL